MDWTDEVRGRLDRKNQILFAKNSAFLQDLRCLIEKQSHKTMILWALEFAGETAGKLKERYPGEDRFQKAVEAAEDWAAGRVKMPFAQQAILRVHAVAKEIRSLEDIALCHAVGQACGTVHAPGHAIGFPIYELTAVIRKHGIESCKKPVEQRKAEYIGRIRYWGEHGSDVFRDWADFLL